MLDDEELGKMIDNLVIAGYLDVVGIDGDSGEFLYSISPELKEMIPALAKMIEGAFLEDIHNLWVGGFLSMDMTALNPMVSLTELAFNDAELKKLSDQEKATLDLIKQAMLRG